MKPKFSWLGTGMIISCVFSGVLNKYFNVNVIVDKPKCDLQKFFPFPQFPPLLYDGDFNRCGYPSCRQAIEMRAVPAVAYNAGTPYGTMSRFTELRDEEDRRSESARPPRRRSPGREESSARRSSPSRQTSSAQTSSSGYPGRRDYQTGVQPPTD